MGKVSDENSGWVTSCAFSPEGTQIVSGFHGVKTKSSDAWFLSFLVSRGMLSREYLRYTFPIAREFNQVTDNFESGPTLAVWDLSSGNIKHLPGDKNTVAACAFSPDGRLILSARHDSRQVSIYPTRTGARGGLLTGHSDDVTACAFSPDGAVIASASANGTVSHGGQ